MKFAVISDTHFVVPGKYPDSVWWYKTINNEPQRRYEALVNTISCQSPDLVVMCGDFTDDTTKDSFFLGKEIMDSIGCPWRTAVGNHDTNIPGVRDEFSDLYGLREKINYYSYDLKNNETIIHFIFIDSCMNLWRDKSIRPHVDMEAFKEKDILKFAIDQEQLEWIERDIAKNRDKNIVLVTHVPIYYKEKVFVGTLPKGKAPFNDYVSLNTLNPELEKVSSGKIKEIIRRNKDCIIAVFSGHTHINEVIVKDDVIFCTTCSLREYPFEIRMIGIEDRHLNVDTYGLDDPLLTEDSYEAWRNNDWVSGYEADRSFIINLKKC